MEFFSIEEEIKSQQFAKLCPNILHVENKGGIRNALGEMFTILGCKYFSADNGKEGIDLYKQHPIFDLVILDMPMPHMNGKATFEEIKRINPKQKFLIICEHTDLKDFDDLERSGVQGWIKKPFNIYTILGKVQNIIFN